MSHIRPYTDVETPLNGADSLMLEEWVQASVQALESVLSPVINEPLSVSLCFSTDAEVQQLNADYRAQDKPTNVLSFPVWERDPQTLEMYLGDIIFAKETLEREAEEMCISIEAHTKHLIVHGLLHLLGFDHIEDAEANLMEGLEIRILSEMGIDNPYV